VRESETAGELLLRRCSLLDGNACHQCCRPLSASWLLQRFLISGYRLVTLAAGGHPVVDSAAVSGRWSSGHFHMGTFRIDQSSFYWCAYILLYPARSRDRIVWSGLLSW